MFNFSNKVVMVTGAAGNLGGAVARAFQNAGAKLILLDKNSERLAKLFPDLGNSKDYLLANDIDVTKVDDVKTIVSKSIKQFGQIDVLVNTVGGYQAGTPVHETPLETWDYMVTLNAGSVFIVCQAVIPHMLKQGQGKIVNVAARAALAGGAKMSAYSAAKSATVRLTESLGAELKSEGINVNCILPGTIDTPQNRQDMPNANHDLWVKADAMADVICFLASDGARAIYGAAVPVYGRS